MSPNTLGEDAVILNKLLPQYNIGRDVYGPSYAYIRSVNAAGFLPVAAAGGVKGFTVHSYPYGGHDCVIDNYLNKSKVTADLYHNLASVTALAKGIPGADKMLYVLEETAGSSGGGCDNVTNRFVAGFCWINTLMTVGRAGFDRVHRQDIAGWSFAFGKSNYELVGPPGWTNGSPELLTPHPDYFTTLLWRQLVGTRVLSTSVSGSADLLETVEVNFWCSAKGTSPYGTGSVVLVFANLNVHNAVELTIPENLAASPSTRYILTGT